jgi:hypothetical protein
VTNGAFETFGAKPRSWLLFIPLLRIVSLLETVGVVAFVAFATELQFTRLIANLTILARRTRPVEKNACSARSLVTLQTKIVVRLAANVAINQLKLVLEIDY